MPVTCQEPVAQVGHARVVGLVGAVRRLQRPPADEVAVDEPRPEAEAVDLRRGCEPACMARLDFRARACPAGQEAHHLGIGVELELVLEMLVAERREREPLRCQDALRHRDLACTGLSVAPRWRRRRPSTFSYRSSSPGLKACRAGRILRPWMTPPYGSRRWPEGSRYSSGARQTRRL